jgi:hypothetical protein
VARSGGPDVGPAERLVSGVVGAGLMTLGLRDIKNPTAKTCLELSAAAYLLFRSVTIFCPIRGLLEKEYLLQPHQERYEGSRRSSFGN